MDLYGDLESYYIKLSGMYAHILRVLYFIVGLFE